MAFQYRCASTGTQQFTVANFKEEDTTRVNVRELLETLKSSSLYEDKIDALGQLIEISAKEAQQRVRDNYIVVNFSIGLWIRRIPLSSENYELAKRGS